MLYSLNSASFCFHAWFWSLVLYFFFFFNDTATTEIYTYLHTLSLHDALPISPGQLHNLRQERSLDYGLHRRELPVPVAQDLRQGGHSQPEMRRTGRWSALRVR